MTTVRPSSPLKITTTYSPSNSPTNLRSPQPPLSSRNSPINSNSKREIIIITTDPIKTNWTNSNSDLGNGSSPRRPLSGQQYNELNLSGGNFKSSPEAMRRLGAGTGTGTGNGNVLTTTEAIGERRRQSNSFKTMSTGSLVSNSPFTNNKRLGSSNSTNTPPPPLPVMSGLYSSSYTSNTTTKSPSIERKVSARNGVRGGSGDSVNINTNENVGGPVRISSGSEGKDFDDISPLSDSPSIPFRSVRNNQDTPNSPSGSIITIPITTPSSPYKSNWGVVAPRQSSSYTASRQNALVSTSPFVNRTPSITTFHDDSTYSPTSSRMNSSPERERERVVSPSTMSTFTSGMGLGIRPGGPLPIAERRIAGSSIPPPSTPPQPRSVSTTSTTSTTSSSSSSYPSSSASALSRRGIKGPRAPLFGEETVEAREEAEAEESSSRMLRRKPSGKTVTWSATEEVLEFDVESERSRSSDISNTTSTSSDSDIGGEASFEYDEADNSIGFEEDGSVVVHDVVGSDTEVEVEADDYLEKEDASAISSASTVEDMMGEIEAFMDNVSPKIDLGPESAFNPHQRELDLAPLSHALPTITNGRVMLATSTLYSAASSQTLEAPAAPLSSSTTTSTLRPNDYSLPSLPSSSPLIGFTELDLPPTSNATVHASSSTISPSGPSHSTPTKFRESFESPLASPFTSSSSTPIPTHLSRHASILESEPYGTSLGSVRGSIRGGSGRLRQGREKFDEKVKAHKALLAEVAPPSSTSSPSLSSVSSFSPNSTNSTSSMTTSPINSNYSPATSVTTIETLEEPRIIQARPALKARTATISSDMLTSIPGAPGTTRLVLGGPFTAEVAHEMESPLDRLQRGVVENHLDDLPSPIISSAVSAPLNFSTSTYSPPITLSSSILTMEDQSVINFSLPRSLSELSNFSASEERNREISSRRKGRNSTEEGRLWSNPSLKKPLRRSLSTGDAAYLDEKSSSPNSKRATMPEAGFTQRLNAALPASESAFGLSLGSSLDSVYRNSQHPSYKVRERKKIVYADDDNDGRICAKISSLKGMVEPVRAWRKKRPSDMGLSMTSEDLKSLIDGGSLNGSVFVSLVEAHFDDLPIPQEATTIICRLDNGRQKAEAGIFKLGQKILLKKEFELSCSANLAFSIDFRIPISANTNVHLLPNYQPAPSLPPTPSSPTKSSSRFLSAFSSPKKKLAILPPPPSPRPTSTKLLPYLSPEGVIGSVHISFKTEASKCRMKPLRLELPFFSNISAHQNVRGGVTLDLFHIPTIAGILKEDLPKSVEEAKNGIALAEKTKEIKFEGILTQMGGDCQTWRRRLIRIIGSRIVPFNEITKKSYVEIDLSSVVLVEDPNAPNTSSSNGKINRSNSQEFDEAPWRVDNSINLVFQDGDSILFFADTKEEKEKWMEVLSSLAGKRVKEAPEWAIQLRKQQMLTL